MPSVVPIAEERSALAPPKAVSGRLRARPALASFPGVLPTNPYQRLLYSELRRFGFTIAADARFDFGWLLRARRDVGFIHFHWPQSFWRHERGPARVRRPLSYVKLTVFAGRLAAARALRYRVAWTVHQVYPHEKAGRRLDRLGAKILAGLSHVVIAHDQSTAELAARELGRPAQRIDIVPHGSYVGVYEAARPREVVRAELGVDPDTVVFLCLGDLRAYKELERLLRSFSDARLPEAALVVAGAVRDDAQGAAVRAAAAADPRIKPLLGFASEERVAELFSAADAAVLARTDGGTSGSLILALSLGTPIIAADVPLYAELLRGGAAGWLFDPRRNDSLHAALELVAGTDADVRRAKGRAALAVAEGLSWPEIAERTAGLLLGAPRPLPRTVNGAAA
jgi:glycosyltransferase involved in cell wall biosynthesis